MQQHSQQRIISIVFVIMFTSLVIVCCYVALNKIKQNTEQSIKNTLQTVLIGVQEAHHILVAQRMIAIESLAESPELVSYSQELLAMHRAQQSTKDSRALHQLRRTISPLLNKFGDRGFFIIAPDFISIASMRDVNIGHINLIHQQEPTRLKQAFEGKTTFIPPVQSDVPIHRGFGYLIDNADTMFITTPITDQNGQIIAVLALRLDPIKHFSDITQLGRLRDSGETYAFNRKGVLLTESRFAYQLIKTNLVPLGQSNISNLRIADPGGNLLDGYQPTIARKEMPLTTMAKQATNGQSGSNLEGYRDYRGVEVFGAWIWDHQFGFGLTTEIDKSEALQSYYDTRDTFVLTIVFTFMLGAVLIAIMIRGQGLAKKQILLANKNLEQKVQARTAELEQAKRNLSYVIKELEVLAITDSLTSLANRRHFDNQLKQEWKRCLRHHKPLSLILFDVDSFKQYNDRYGHSGGDQCLVQIAEMLAHSNLAKRPGDLIARYGGEEFVVLLSDADEDYTRAVAERIRDGVSQLSISHDNTKVAESKHVTVSVGFAVAHIDQELSSEDLLVQADEALYLAKHSGRNRVCQYLDTSESGNVTKMHKKPSES